ncbi:glycosyltransferase family 2 protein [Sulfurimonas sp. HSL-1716]|uniref:glycosyltransferase family 2 protein n=1 Tax=Hydrocurvibacter sulfurireducens TaxID=3131937 RepID=UPI0031F7672D
MKDLAIVICNYNKVEYLKECLHSISNAVFENYSKDIIVVDNLSNDGSADMIEKHFPDVILIRNNENSGGAGGFAKGMQYALDHGYRYVSLLDNDTKVEKNNFINLIKHLNDDSSIGVAGSTILQMDNPQNVQEVGAMLDWENYILKLNYKDFNIENPIIPQQIECDYVPACCLMTTGEVLQKAGIFDRDYFIYLDDIDWCTRVKDLGYKIVAFKDSLVWHKGGAKIATNTMYHYYYYRNMTRFFLKNISPDKLEHFINEVSSKISKMMFFANLKGQTSSVRSMLIGIDDAYAKRLGAQWSGIYPKKEAANKIYELSSTKQDILIIDNIDSVDFQQTIVNIRMHTDAKITVLAKYLEFEYVSSILDNIDNAYATKEIGDLSEYDMVIQSVEHITNYKDYDECGAYIDAFGNCIADDADKINVQSYGSFMTMFDNITKPVLQHKFTTLFKELNIK